MIAFIASMFEEYRRCTSVKYSADPYRDPFRDRARAVAIAWLLFGVGVLVLLSVIGLAVLAGYLIAPIAAFVVVLLAVGFIVIDLLRWVHGSNPDRKDTFGQEDAAS